MQKSFSQSKQNSLNWNLSNDSVRADKPKLLVWKRASLKIKPEHFLSLHATHSSGIRHSVREITVSMWKQHLFAFTSWFFCLGSLSLILYEEVVFQKYFCSANFSISSWHGFVALSCAHSLPVPAGTSRMTVTWGLSPHLADRLVIGMWCFIKGFFSTKRGKSNLICQNPVDQIKP